MWLFKSSIGRKFVMAVTGACLVLFVTFHCLMNSVALIWPAAYNQVCEFLGANWYALIASVGLGALMVLHIVYALWLTLQNRKARGTDRYAVTSRPKQVEWASKNMLVLGLVVLAFLGLHLVQFWAKMQLQELRHADLAVLPQLQGVPVGPAMGTLFLQAAFAQIWTPVLYIIGFVALWFHMTHGFWSMFHTAGWDNNIWIGRLKCIGNLWTTVVIALFVAQAVVFSIRAHSNYYVENEQLQEQYAEYWNDEAKKTVDNFLEPINAKQKQLMGDVEQPTVQQQVAMQNEWEQWFPAYIAENGPAFVAEANAIDSAVKVQCSKLPTPDNVARIKQMRTEIQRMIDMPNPNTQQQH